MKMEKVSNSPKIYKVYHRPNHFSQFENMRKKSELCDITIKAKEEEFQAHKIVLAAAFSYFHKLFIDNQEGKEKEGKDIISITEIEATNLESIIEFAYTGQIKITEINVLSLLRDVEFLDEIDIKDACLKFLKEFYLTSETALQVYRLSEGLDSISLKEASKNTISRHLNNISESEEFLKIQVDVLKDILSENKFSYEKEYFEATIKWLMHDIDNRKIHLKGLMNYIQLSIFTSDYLVNYLLKTIPRKYSDIIGEIISSCGNLANTSEDCITIIDRQKPHQIQVYNLRTDKWCSTDWEIVRSMVLHENSFGCSVLNNKLYLVGGRDDFKRFTSNVMVYDALTKYCQLVSNMIHERSDPAVCSLAGHLYVCGGWNDMGVLNVVERYDPIANKWEVLPSMQHPRSDAAAVSFNDCIYVIGGCNRASGALDSVERYDPSTNQWSVLSASMRQGRAALGAAVLDGKLYACGGDVDEISNRSSTAEVYDPKLNKWQYVASMQEIRLRFLLVAHEKQLYAIGGIANSTMESYNPHTDSWTFLSSSDLPAKGLTGGIMKGGGRIMN